MKNIKGFNIFESSEESDIVIAKELVRESLLELSEDNDLKVDIFDDRFSSGDSYGSCFSVMISKEITNSRNIKERVPFNFQEVFDNIWQSFNVPTDYGFYFFAMSIDIPKDKMYFVWAPLEATNLEEVLEGRVGDVSSIGMTFVKESDFKDKIEDIKKKDRTQSLPGLEY